MRNIIFLSSLLIIVQASCAPSTTATPTVRVAVLPTITPVPTITLTPNPPVAFSTPTSDMPSPTASPFVMSELASPNGEYIAYSYFYYGTEQQTIEIQDKEGKLIWQIPFQGELPHYDPRPTIGMYQWSKDSSQLYFCYYWSPDGGDIIVQWTGYDLQKIDIKTGSVQRVLPGSGYMTFAISPDESQIAYVRKQDQPGVISVRNLSTDIERTAYIIIPRENYVTLGNMEWSPNGKGLVFETQDNNHMVRAIYLNLTTMKQRVIKEYPVINFPGWAVFQRWVNNHILEFAESGDNGVQIIQIDIESKETVVIGTPTPSE